MSSASRPLPEDLTIRPQRYYIGGADHVGMGYAHEMAEFGRTHGFDVVALPDIKWFEDNGQIAASGREVSYLPTIDFAVIVDAVTADRQRRWSQRATEFGRQGSTAKWRDQGQRISFARGQGWAMRADLGYLERGNVLVGTRVSGELYAIVGADSIAASKVAIQEAWRQLTRSLGNRFWGSSPSTPSDEQVREAVARDIGVATEDLIVVEQPAAFHLDMKMAPWTPGVVILNDSTQAWNVVKKTHLAQTSPSQAGAEDALTHSGARMAYGVMIGLEEQAAEDLRQAGLRVVRAPGVYLQSAWPRSPAANFFNGEGGTGPDGRHFWATQGGPDPYVAAFSEALRKAGVAVPELLLISQSLSDLSLDSTYSGLACRAQPVVKK